MLFLVGCWSRARGDGARSEEVWTGPYGDTMYGQSLEFDDDPAPFFELLRIECRDNDRLVYIARPGGGRPVEFEQTNSDNGSVTFENPSHDFPKRIRYEREGPHALSAVADDGTDDGKRLEFSWQAVR